MSDHNPSNLAENGSPLNHEGARLIRLHWFRYLDTIEPFREALAGYCYKLTGNIWDAEDLVQETLLKGFGMTARGDFHGPDSPVRDAKAYLFRTATNQFLDVRRRASRVAASALEEVGTIDADPVHSSDAVKKALHLASSQEFAALLLKDVYEFSLDEIADFLGTTAGTIKSALSRARAKMQKDHQNVPKPDQNTAQLVDRFVSAINSGDADQVIALMVEQVQISVCNVGGGRGREGNWSSKSLNRIKAAAAVLEGEPIVLMLHEGQLIDVLRLEGESQVTRLVDYCYAPETLQHVAKTLDMTCPVTAYHQPWEVILGEMVPTTFLPWQEGAD